MPTMKEKKNDPVRLKRVSPGERKTTLKRVSPERIKPTFPRQETWWSVLTGNLKIFLLGILLIVVITLSISLGARPPEARMGQVIDRDITTRVSFQYYDPQDKVKWEETVKRKT